MSSEAYQVLLPNYNVYSLHFYQSSTNGFSPLFEFVSGIKLVCGLRIFPSRAQADLSVFSKCSLFCCIKILQWKAFWSILYHCVYNLCAELEVNLTETDRPN